MLQTPMKGQERVEVSCCCCVSGEVQATFQIDRRGFVPGENIYINAEVVNNSNTSVSGTRVALKQVDIINNNNKNGIYIGPFQSPRHFT